MNHFFPLMQNFLQLTVEAGPQFKNSFLSNSQGDKTMSTRVMGPSGT